MATSPHATYAPQSASLSPPLAATSSVCSRANSAPNAAPLVKLHTAEYMGELVTRLQLLAHRRGHIATQTLSHSVFAPYCKCTRVGTSTSTSTPFSISVRPFSEPHIILKEWFTIVRPLSLQCLHLPLTQYYPVTIQYEIIFQKAFSMQTTSKHITLSRLSV